MKIKIYQLVKDPRELAFMRFTFVQSRGGVDPSEYDLVWEGEVDAEDLEDVYCIFNRYDLMPTGYGGRSLSVSDVVVTEEGAFFCDAAGFIKLEEEFEEVK